MLREKAAGFSGWAVKSFFSYSLYWSCVSSVSLYCSLYQFSLLSYCSISDPWNLGFSLCAWCKRLHWAKQEKCVQGTQKCGGSNLASPSVLAASCEGGHLQMWWHNPDPHPQPFSLSTENVKFLRAAENLPVKLLSCLQVPEQRPWLAILVYFVYFVVFNILAAPLPSELAVLHTQHGDPAP